MLIGVAGPPCAGKSALVAYLAQRHGFRPLRLRTASQPAGDSVNGQPPASERLLTTDEVLDRVTPQWREHFVVYPIDDMDTLNRLRVRPFFLLVAVDAPVLTRYRRHQAKFAYVHAKVDGAPRNATHRREKPNRGRFRLAAGPTRCP